MNDAERRRLADADAGAQPWRAWGPYLSERAWGTVREDYSEHGTAWEYFPHDHARSRAYRWNEDGLAGVCDERQTFCFGLALWNGVDPILKERLFGLTGNEGNHGEDAKEYWWYTDSTPTHSWMSWRYHYPQREFPYSELVAVNRQLERAEPEYELADTGVFADDRYWVVTADYAKAEPTDLCVLVSLTNRASTPATIHVLPTLWFRNTWSWGLPGRDDKPEIIVEQVAGGGGALHARHRILGQLVLQGDGDPTPLACDNETNARRLWGYEETPDHPKDAIADHVVHGTDTVNPAGVGTKAALHYVLTVPPGETARIRLRLTQVAAPGSRARIAPALPGDFDEIMTARRTEADDYFAQLVPAGTPSAEADIVRKAVAGLMWGKQFYHYDVARWLDGDPGSVPPPDGHRYGRNHTWRHMTSFDVISMPDPWEYPWYAAWDLAFHCVALARVDPHFAKEQLLLLLRDWYLHPNGQIPAYEWAFGDVNPPVHAWAALRVFEIDGARDFAFLARIMHKLLLNFTWWVNRKDTGGNNLFEGGFLGLDNVGPFDRSASLPVPGVLEQSDGTAWMAMYALNLLEISLVLATHDRVWTDIATKFLEHFAYIANAASDQGLWDDEDGFFYDVLRRTDGREVPLKVRSVVGLLPLCATTTLSSVTLVRLPEIAARLRWFLTNRPEFAEVVGSRRISGGGQQQRLLAVVGPEQLRRILSRMLDEEEFLSPYGLRSLSRYHLANPYTVRLGGNDFTVGYEPAESTNGLFGGNSNWRGPIWFPVNYLLIEGVRHYARFFHEDLQVEFPTRSGQKLTLDQIADDLSDRLIALFLPDGNGDRPYAPRHPQLPDHADWTDHLLFYEYFHGDTGLGLGAAHQCGWTALVLDLILTRRHPDPSPDPR
ncbi:MGH1-like glycoside hydrolase domain-containing protein [Catellatospora tritici]|uniref:MGH1-like glycoside hydrolase domain-containing protein n=1 Tax=Catellatospora tritici TaxID=2851566 RepID=UPI0027E16231|nr:glucosidase [Catellatospora tritici]